MHTIRYFHIVQSWGFLPEIGKILVDKGKNLCYDEKKKEAVV